MYRRAVQPQSSFNLAEPQLGVLSEHLRQSKILSLTTASALASASWLSAVLMFLAKCCLAVAFLTNLVFGIFFGIGLFFELFGCVFGELFGGVLGFCANALRMTCFAASSFCNSSNASKPCFSLRIVRVPHEWHQLTKSFIVRKVDQKLRLDTTLSQTMATETSLGCHTTFIFDKKVPKSTIIQMKTFTGTEKGFEIDMEILTWPETALSRNAWS